MFEAALIFCRGAIDFTGKFDGEIEVASYALAVGVNHGEQAGGSEGTALFAVGIGALQIRAFACGDRIGGSAEAEIEFVGIALGEGGAVLVGGKVNGRNLDVVVAVAIGGRCCGLAGRGRVGLGVGARVAGRRKGGAECCGGVFGETMCLVGGFASEEKFRTSGGDCSYEFLFLAPREARSGWDDNWMRRPEQGIGVGQTRNPHPWKAKGGAPTRRAESEILRG